MTRRALIAGIGAACTILLSCNPLLGPLPSGMIDSPSVQHVPYTGSFTYSVNPGSTPRDVYFVFTNPSVTQDAAQAPTVSGDTIKVDGVTLPSPAPQPLPSRNSAPSTLADRIAEFNRNPPRYLSSSSFPRPLGAAYVSTLPAQNDTDGILPHVQPASTGIFLKADSSGYPTISVNATCRLVVGPENFADGRTRTLSIWVDDTDWSAGTVNIGMVNALAQRFLQSPESIDDIYHWDTAVVGEPWGPQTDPQLIPWDANNTITILLTQLNSPAAYAGGSVLVGYFWAKDNFTTAALSGSNQRIMFYIDSVLYSTVLSSETGWQVTNYWPRIVFSTLAHEFQHMIQFYQKQVLRGAATGTDTWINEMCSMLMEDLVADKLGVEGPRGVVTADGSAGPNGIVDGRIPGFNSSSNSPLAVTATGPSFGLTDYSVAYAFGAWLARNYGGASLLKNIVQCSQTDSSAVVNAAGTASGRVESMERLMEKWSAAVLLSDTTTAPAAYRYNTGGWTASSAGGLSFNLGSINIFNYSPPLTVYSSVSPIPAPPYYSSNVYYLAAGKLGAPRTFSITLPQGVLMSVVLK